jgi:hypothetical protein
MKKSFVKLCNLLDLTYEGETDEQRKAWVSNVVGTVGTEGYTLDTNGDDYTVKEFSADEVEFDDVSCYNFMGSALEQERFYSAEWFVVREKATGDLYALETEDIYEF